MLIGNVTYQHFFSLISIFYHITVVRFAKKM